jgi:DNA (cytosine-5)-methyltransferase 1
MRVARLFSGFDGAGEGIKAAGFDMAWAIEKDPAIAAVAELNHYPTIVANILDVDPATLERPDGIHASPVCTNASLANSSAEINEDGTKETRLDRDCAMKTVQFVEVLRPRFFTLENVWQYRLFQSFMGGDKCEGILPALKRLGYKVGYWHINSADYGVPQTRKRLILIASLDFTPTKPQETHYDPVRPELSAPSLFAPTRRPWVGWYEAIEDLIPTLPESQFAPWQLARLPEELQNVMVNTNMSGDEGENVQINDESEPAFTITQSANGRLRAFIVGSQYEQSQGTPNRRPQQRQADEPVFTITASGGTHNDSRAWLSQGRVVKMTPRALARFQSFADSYQLSGNNTLDCKGIGNACPPLLFRRIYEMIKAQL